MFMNWLCMILVPCYNLCICAILVVCICLVGWEKWLVKWPIFIHTSKDMSVCLSRVWHVARRHDRVSLVIFKGLQVMLLHGLAHGLSHGRVRLFRRVHDLAHGHMAWPCDPSQWVTRAGTRPCVSTSNAYTVWDTDLSLSCVTPVVLKIFNVF